jgi:hypothetical protein
VFWFIYFNFYYAFYVGAVILSAQIIYNLVIALTAWFQLVGLISLNSQQQDAEESLEEHDERLEVQEEKTKRHAKELEAQAKTVEQHDAFLLELRQRISTTDFEEISRRNVGMG